MLIFAEDFHSQENKQIKQKQQPPNQPSKKKHQPNRTKTPTPKQNKPPKNKPNNTNPDHTRRRLGSGCFPVWCLNSQQAQHRSSIVQDWRPLKMFKFLLKQVMYFCLEGELDLWENSASVSF